MNLYPVIEELIKNIKDPIIFFNNVIDGKVINELLDQNMSLDECMSIYIKFFLKYHNMIAMEYNLLKINNNINNYILTVNVIKDYYMYISYLLKIIPILNNWKDIYNNPFFWKQDINKQLVLLLKLKDTFYSLFDCTKGTLYFHVKLKDGPMNQYHVDEMVDRLEKVYKMFKFNFFLKIKCTVLTIDEFVTMTFTDMVNYVEYIFTIINNILNHYIFNFQIYDFYRNQLDNMVNPVKPIHIDMIDVSSELEIDDINYIFTNKIIYE